MKVLRAGISVKDVAGVSKGGPAINWPAIGPATVPDGFVVIAKLAMHFAFAAKQCSAVTGDIFNEKQVVPDSVHGEERY